MFNEVHKFNAIGETRDIITYEDGTVVDTGWGRNKIVFNFNVLVAGLLKADPLFSGIKYWAIGSGLPEWDNVRPEPQVADTGCVNEFYRKAIPTENIKYLDVAGNETVSATNRLQIRLVFSSAEAVGKWRDFSIFGANATATLNSGLALNHRTHGLIDKTNTMTIERIIRFTFS